LAKASVTPGALVEPLLALVDDEGRGPLMAVRASALA